MQGLLNISFNVRNHTADEDHVGVFNKLYLEIQELQTCQSSNY